MAKQNLYQRVDEAIERGETWRAKEMLRGNVGSGSYDSQLYERYGKLLLDLGELDGGWQVPVPVGTPAPRV